MNDRMKDHWSNVYVAKEINRLGWYEEVSEPSIRLISKCRIDKDDPVLDVGAGASTLIDYLLDQGYKNITAVDISEIALKKLRERLGEEKSRRVRWIADDITQPVHVNKLSDIVLWHDRALLHFLLKQKERERSTFPKHINSVAFFQRRPIPHLLGIVDTHYVCSGTHTHSVIFGFCHLIRHRRYV